MTLRGKDFCNCDHAQLLRTAIERARFELRFPSGSIPAMTILREALEEDNRAKIELWGFGPESE